MLPRVKINKYDFFFEKSIIIIITTIMISFLA